MFKNQGTSQPEASQQQLATVNGDKSWASEQEELLELDEVQLATVVGGVGLEVVVGGDGAVVDVNNYEDYLGRRKAVVDINNYEDYLNSKNKAVVDVVNNYEDYLRRRK